MKRGKSINTHIPNPDQDSVRIKTVSNSVIRAYCFPRHLIENVKNYLQRESANLYYLFGYDEKSLEPCIYIGESADTYRRLKEHIQEERIDWNFAFVFESLTEKDLDTTATRFLESHSYKLALSIGRYKLVNRTKPHQPHITRGQKDCYLDCFDIIKLLMNDAGYLVFKSITDTEDDMTFYLKHKTTSGAKGQPSSQGFVVFKGSAFTKTFTKSLYSSHKLLHRQLVKDGLLLDKGEHYILQKDYIFPTPSTAGQVITGTVGNGWQLWKNATGQTLREAMEGTDYK
ncbi:GIY-YIG nuclease family protein [Sediminitomix flava]|uniref:Uncharacterized protein DUF4357 n=1 Tax=Sediminitomix flava TaxID=379075 RepID=A0A315Z5D5_SEDFL|nr:GIY-YIG nuclease family protein [Sediminitomix flava]PWJ38632.1 uncharacterized protein DUF4357 [Sediminitomix flava]